jgi:hypothetical protein
MENLKGIKSLSDGIMFLNKVAFYEGIEAGFRMIEVLLDKEQLPESLTKDDLRAIICEFRRNNDDAREKLLEEVEEDESESI